MFGGGRTTALRTRILRDQDSQMYSSAATAAAAAVVWRFIAAAKRDNYWYCLCCFELVCSDCVYVCVWKYMATLVCIVWWRWSPRICAGSVGTAVVCGVTHLCLCWMPFQSVFTWWWATIKTHSVCTSRPRHAPRVFLRRKTLHRTTLSQKLRVELVDGELRRDFGPNMFNTSQVLVK